jgi:hypothetical protein
MPDNEEKDVRTLFEEIKQGRNCVTFILYFFP